MNNPAKPRVLVVDDELSICKACEKILSRRGIEMKGVLSGRQAIVLLDQEPFDIVFTDLRMTEMGGMELLQVLRSRHPEIVPVVITGHSTIASVVETMKLGAFDYLPKPFTPEELIAILDKAWQKRQRILESRAIASGEPLEQFAGIIGRSPKMQELFTQIGKVAPTSSTVLIIGESGTGKELVARAIHYSSPRASAPFVPINCGGIPEGLLESELFGYVRGAFTGATETRAGFFQTAEGGTLFLDEISETSASMQVKLLRVLQDKEVCMVGDTRVRKVDVRVIAATNKDLLSLVQKNVFREDLFFRLNVITITIPPLRERGDDTLRLASHFAARYAREFGRPVPRFTEAALRIIAGYYWPGNVRELENFVQRVVVMSERELVDVTDLPAHMRFSAARESGLNRTLAEVEAEHIRNVLAGVDGNKTRAAEILGVDRKTLRDKLKKLDESPPKDTAG